MRLIGLAGFRPFAIRGIHTATQTISGVSEKRVAIGLIGERDSQKQKCTGRGARY